MTVSIGHTVFVLAIVYRIVLTRTQSISRSLIEALRDLGATRWQSFRYVSFPQLGSALAVAAVLAFALSFDENITLFVVGGYPSPSGAKTCNLPKQGSGGIRRTWSGCPIATLHDQPA